MTEVMLPARYTTTRGDLFRFYVNHYLHSWGYLTFQIVVLAFLSHTFYRALPVDAPRGVRFLVFSIFLLLGVVFLIVVFLASIATALFSKKNKTMTTEHSITLKQNGILEETPFNTTEHTWAAVQRLRRSRELHFHICRSPSCPRHSQTSICNRRSVGCFLCVLPRENANGLRKG